MNNKKVAIIGAGISGLSAGIYALQTGYDVTIYEKNKMPGGECTTWERQGYLIDNCIHFLVGCNEDDKLYELWKNVGVIDNDITLYREPYFYSLEMDNKKLYLWRDLERTKRELLSVAPEDEKELNLFFECVKKAECIKPPSEMSPAHMNPFQFMKMGMSMMDAGKVNSVYGKQTMQEFCARFKNPYIKALFGNYFNDSFIALTYVTSYAFYTSNTVAIPEGGSKGMVSRMVSKLKVLGGTIEYGAEITKAIIKDQKVESLECSKGTAIQADYYIWCADPHGLFYEVLDESYIDKNLKYMYEKPDGYVGTTGYQAAFGINSDEKLDLPEGSVIFPCKEYKVANQSHNFCGIRVYDYDESLFPSDKRVIQCNLLQTADDYLYWKNLKKDSKEYNQEKQRVAEELQLRVEQQYPQLKGKLILLGTYSPVTFTTWCNAYMGAYMSFNALKGYKSKYVKSSIKNIGNLFLGSQWIQNGGGLPTAATGGKFAVQIMDKYARHKG